MGNRRLSRELALQLLYGSDINSQDASSYISGFFDGIRTTRSVRVFSEQLFTGVNSVKERIDTLIKEKSPRWDFSRISPVERNILRLCVYEMMFAVPHTPAAVAIDEGVELAKKYGSDTSSRFVNGILDEIRKTACADNVD